MIKADAFDIQEGTIQLMDPDSWTIKVLWYVSGVTIDGRRPEEFVNVIGGQIRRRKPEETDWSIDSVVLYDNINDLKVLKNAKFSIVIMMTCPDRNLWQKLTVNWCRIADENLTINDSSTFRFNGRADGWDIENYTL